MGHELRYYQTEASHALLNHDYGTGAPVAVLPTGTGKSLVIADVVRNILADNSNARIIVATHTQDIIEQNFDEFNDAFGYHGSVGIYSAGLNRREGYKQILFAGIQSVYNKTAILKRCDILIIDEAHSIPRKSNTMWRKFINALMSLNPNMVVIGLTATPFRLDSGLITEGKDALFSTIVYEYTIMQAIKDGYLVRPVVPPVETRLNRDVSTRGGEFIAGELERAVDVDETTQAALDELIYFGAERKTWLVFGAGVKHCNNLAAALRARGIDAEALTHETPKDEAREIKRRFKAGELRAVVNSRMMTTGTNVPRIDLIADFYPTESAGLHIQKLGRGFRLWLAGGKVDCLILDFAGNTRKHGPLDQIEVSAYKERKPGDAPVKLCPPPCNSVVFASTRICPYCDHEFHFDRTIAIEATADRDGILSEDRNKPKWVDVLTVKYTKHIKEGAKYGTLKAAYYSLGMKAIYEFVCLDHPEGSLPWVKARDWCTVRGMAMPNGVDQAINIPWPKPTRIEVYKNGDYWNVKKVSFDA